MHTITKELIISNKRNASLFSCDSNNAISVTIELNWDSNHKCEEYEQTIEGLDPSTVMDMDS